MKTIESLKLGINAYDIKNSILKTKKINLKDQNVLVKNVEELQISTSNSTEEGLFFALQLLKKRLPEVIVKGIESVKRIVIQKESHNNKDKYILLLEGTGLKYVMTSTGVRGTTAKTNHIIEMMQVLGIEAGRQSIVNEISGVMESHGITVDKRHILLLADTMTYTGRILGNTRHGLVKQKDSIFLKKGTLMLASFESPQDILFDSGFFRRKDNLLGVSECVIMVFLIILG